VLANATPFGAMPTLVGGVEATGAVVRDGQGRLVFEAKRAGLHVFGHTRSRLLDGFGIFLFASAIAGVGGHALLRVRSARRRNQERT
jgi:hypothetical protein